MFSTRDAAGSFSLIDFEMAHVREKVGHPCSIVYKIVKTAGEQLNKSDYYYYYYYYFANVLVCIIWMKFEDVGFLEKNCSTSI